MVHFLLELTLVFLQVWRQVIRWPYSGNWWSVSFALHFRLWFDIGYLLALAFLGSQEALLMMVPWASHHLGHSDVFQVLSADFMWWYQRSCLVRRSSARRLTNIALQQFVHRHVLAQLYFLRDSNSLVLYRSGSLYHLLKQFCLCWA